MKKYKKEFTVADWAEMLRLRKTVKIKNTEDRIIKSANEKNNFVGSKAYYLLSKKEKLHARAVANTIPLDAYLST